MLPLIVASGLQIIQIQIIWRVYLFLNISLLLLYKINDLFQIKLINPNTRSDHRRAEATHNLYFSILFFFFGSMPFTSSVTRVYRQCHRLPPTCVFIFMIKDWYQALIASGVPLIAQIILSCWEYLEERGQKLVLHKQRESIIIQ